MKKAEILFLIEKIAIIIYGVIGTFWGLLLAIVFSDFCTGTSGCGNLCYYCRTVNVWTGLFFIIDITLSVIIFLFVPKIKLVNIKVMLHVLALLYLLVGQFIILSSIADIDVYRVYGIK